MSALRWIGVLVAALAGFVAVGSATTLAALRWGRDWSRWNDTAEFEVWLGTGAGAIAGLLLIVWLSRRLQARQAGRA
jgi:hypothetical protein